MAPAVFVPLPLCRPYKKVLMSDLVHDLIFTTARRLPAAEALAYGSERLDYAGLEAAVRGAAAMLLGAGIGPRERVAVYLEKRIEAVAAMFGASAAGAVFVPVNPMLKGPQLAHILADCNARVLVTSGERLRQLAGELAHCPDLHTVVVVGAASVDAPPGCRLLPWSTDGAPPAPGPHGAIDADMAAILYTSGSTGKPKGVVLSHRNIVAGARSVAGYLGNTQEDRILAVLPLSFDYGLSQLTTAFLSGACAVLINHLFPRDVLKAVLAERITGLAAVPPLWIQLSQLDWPADCSLRYLTNSGGAMPGATVDALRAVLPRAQLFLMYGLTEAFRSTYLPPAELARRPGSMGRAIPNAEVLVVRPDGSLCEADEPGELVHRGTLVSLGYWNDPVKTAERYRPAPGQDPALPLTELAVWSGDTVRRDADGYLYFIGRSDDMIKVSGYRVSPSEVEEVLHASALVEEAVAFGVPHPDVGNAIVVLAVARGPELDAAALLAECRRRLPAWMVPARIELRPGPLPRNPNGKFDRPALRQPFIALFDHAQSTKD